MSDLWWALHDYATILWRIETGRPYDDFDRVEKHKEIIGLCGYDPETILHNFPKDGYEYLPHEAERLIIECKQYQPKERTDE